MKVFKACMIIIKRHIVSLSLYFGIFLALSVIMPSISFEQLSTDFTNTRPNYTIINRDGDTPLSMGLAGFLSGRGNEVALDDREDTLRDAAFYHATDYIAIIPQGFSDAFWDGGTLAIQTVITTETAKGYYADSLVDQYLNQVRINADANSLHKPYEQNEQNEQNKQIEFNELDEQNEQNEQSEQNEQNELDKEAIISAVLSDLSVEAKVETKQFGAGAPVDEVFQVFMRLMCYIILVMIILCVSNVTSAFRRPDMRMRNLCSPLKPRSMSWQQILCGTLISILAWLLVTSIGFIIYGSKLAATDWRTVLLIMLNSFAATVVALSIASLAGPFINSPNSQNAIANFVSLGLCFLGGVFVPLDLMGAGILTVARFTPLYWYAAALDHICGLNTYTRETLSPVWQAMATQLAFAAAFFCVALVVSKQQNQSERSFSSIRTELEA